MKVFDYLNANREVAMRLSELGLLKYKVELYMAMYSKYLYYLGVGYSRTKAVKQTCEDFHTCTKTGWVVLKELEHEL